MKNQAQTADPSAAHLYRLCGLRLASSRPLPFLVSAMADGDGPPDLWIRVEPVSLPTDAVVQIGSRISVAPDGTAWVNMDGAGYIRVAGGTEIVADLPALMPEAEIHSWLCGVAFAILCHQRATPALHACVMAVGTRAVAVAGYSGAGKSTTTVAMLQRGHQLVVDDQAIVDPDSLTVSPGFPAVKLWAAAAIPGYVPDPKDRMRPGIDKFLVRVTDQFASSPVRLAGVVVLRADPAISEPFLEPVPWPDSAALLHGLVHLPDFGMLLDSGRAGLSIMTRIARSVPVFILRRPIDMGKMDRIADSIEGIVQSQGADLP